jgi:hypothetical protein
MVDLADVTKTGGNEYARTVVGPRLESGGADILVAVEVRDYRLWNRGDVFHDEVAVIGFGTGDISQGKRTTDKKGQADGEQKVMFHVCSG